MCFCMSYDVSRWLYWMPVLIVHSISWIRVDALDTKAGRLPLHQARVEVGDHCFYSKLKHCKSYFGVSTQTTGITMLVIVCIFLIADWNNWFWNAFSQVRIPWYQSITARLSTFTKINDLSKKEASFWGDENPSLIRDLLDILPGVIILLLGLSVMGYVIPYAFRFPLNHEMNIPPFSYSAACLSQIWSLL